ncbi:MAG: hypothetical protein GXW91_07905 [Clostridiales bacterium]|nr:hypothetical protein [Clostridiales bacterium]
MLTIREAMEIEAFKKVKLIAGKEGIDRVIESVTVMEVTDTVQWLEGGEFIITSFYSVRDKIDEQCDIVYRLGKLNAAGIAIKINKYVPRIPDKLIKIANELKLSMFEIPSDVTYLSIMTPLNQKIFRLKEHFMIVEEYVKGIIFHTYKTIDSVIERGKALGYDIKEGYICAVTVDIDGYDNPDLMSIRDRLYKYIDSITRALKRKKQIINYIIVRNAEYVTLFLQSDNKINAERYEKEVLNLILKYRDIYYKNTGMTIGIGNIGYGISGIEDGYDQAKYAIKLGRVIGKKQDYYFYKDIEIYSLGYKNSSDVLHSVVRSTLGKILDEAELMETISTYFECNESIKLTSEMLFIHKNTLKYRLERIRMITGLDVKNIDDKVRLYLAIIANSILTKK